MKSSYSSLPRLLTIILILISIDVLNAATRFKDIVFTSVSAKKDIQYGSNTGVNGSVTPLLVDFYEPANDNMTLRPLVIFIHGGSLTAGARMELDYYCTDFAKRGYAAATIDYRLGIENPKNVKTCLEALLRGVQDTKAAVRFFYAHAAEYGIDTSQIYLEGSSAGSMIAVHYAFWDQSEIPADIDQAKWGNIEGISGNPGYPTKIKGVVNYCGALVDCSWIDPGEPPVGNFHGLLDPVVPADDAISTDFGIRLRGGVAISRVATECGIYNQGAFFPNMAHGGNEDSLRVFSSNFIYSLIVLSSAVPNDFSSPAISPKILNIFRFDKYTFQTSALHKSGNRIILPFSMIQYSCDSRIGTISQYGAFNPGQSPDSGSVTVNFNNTSDVSAVKVYDLKYFVISPQNAVTDSVKPLQIKIDTYDQYSTWHKLTMSNFKLRSTVLAVGTIDSTGLFTGLRNGTTKIIATCSGFSDTCIISVESASGFRSFESLENLDEWALTTENIDSARISLSEDQKSEGTSSLKLEYWYTYNSQKPNCFVYLNNELPVYGIPDSIYLDSKSDGKKHKLFYRFNDADNNVWRASGKRYLNDSLVFANINTPMSSLAKVSGPSDLSYPLTLDRIEIQLAGSTANGSKNSGVIYIDNLRFKYPGETPTGEVPDEFSMMQNYPNPFNYSTSIEFNLSLPAKVTLKVYDILGREVVELVNSTLNPGYYSVPFNGISLASGIYIYRIQTNQHTDVKKMVLLK